MDTIRALFQRFIAAEGARLVEGDHPVVVLSFGGEEGPVTEFAVTLDDARELVVGVLCALADHDDAKAEQVLDAHFRGD